MITSQDIRDLEDASSISKVGLMENAGKKIYEILKEKFDIENKSILVATYHGNNGGDGFVTARHLCSEAETDLLFLGDESKFKEESKAAYKKIENEDRIQFLNEEEINFDDYDIIIDAILGIGIQGQLKEQIATIIEKINESKATKVSIDIPTGVNPDTGEEKEKYVNPDLIITFHDLKPGLEKFKDKVVVADIGLGK